MTVKLGNLLRWETFMMQGDEIGRQSKRGILGFGGLTASCEAVLKSFSWRKDVSIE